MAHEDPAVYVRLGLYSAAPPVLEPLPLQIHTVIFRVTSELGYGPSPRSEQRKFRVWI